MKLPKKLTALHMLIGAYLLSRLLLIGIFPLFFDEAIYIRWSQYIINDPSWQFISLTDGKQPLFIWLTTIMQLILPFPIITGRVVSVLAGLGSLIGIYLLTKELFNKKTALIASALYVITPFTLLYDSLALMDSLLMCLSVYAFYFTFRFTKTLKIHFAIIAGVIIGLGLLTKSSAMFSLYLFPLSVLMLRSISLKPLTTFIVGMLLTFGIAKLFESVMRFSAYYEFIVQKNSVFIYSTEEILKDPLLVFFPNAQTILMWLLYLIGTLLLLPLLSFFDRKELIKKLILLAYAVAPILALMVFGKQMYPRYLLFMTFPLIVLSGYALWILLEKMKQKQIAWLVIGLLLLYPLLNSLLILFTPQKAVLPQIERWQLLTGEPSGIGLPKVISFFKEKDTSKLILADKPLGILSDGIGISLFHDKETTVTGLDSIDKDAILRNYRKADPNPQEVYLVLSWQAIPPDVPVEEMLVLDRPEEDKHDWKIYRVRKDFFKRGR